MSQTEVYASPLLARWWARGKGSLAKFRTSIHCCQPNVQLHDMKTAKLSNASPTVNLNCQPNVQLHDMKTAKLLLSYASPTVNLNCQPNVQLHDMKTALQANSTVNLNFRYKYSTTGCL